MDKIIIILGGLGKPSRNDDDSADRISYRYTTTMLIVLSFIISTKQYVGDPINCWVPAHFTENHAEYTNSYCWIRNTYYLPFEDRIPREYEQHQTIPYYQWVPIILLVQALLFYLPIFIWRTMNDRAGLDVNNVVEAANSFENVGKADKMDDTLKFMTVQMDRFLENQHESQATNKFTLSLKNLCTRVCCKACSSQSGTYLTSLYLAVKIIFIGNVLGQLFALNYFLGQDYHFYGVEVIQAWISGTDWTQSSRFPRVTMCDFKVRRLGNVQRYTVQCVLSINLFNEKVYLFIWFWMVLVAVVTLLSFVQWLMRALFRLDRHRYIKKHLHLMNKLEDSEDKKLAGKFVDKYLKKDGVFVMRLVAHNTNTIAVTEFVTSLWENYKKKRRDQGVDEEEFGRKPKQIDT